MATISHLNSLSSSNAAMGGTAAVHSSMPQRYQLLRLPPQFTLISGGSFGGMLAGGKHSRIICKNGGQCVKERGARRWFPIVCQTQESERRGKITPAQGLSRNRSFVGFFLEKALGGFLKSQLEDCRELKVMVGGSNQELLAGKLKEVQVTATKAVFKGISFTTVDLLATEVLIKLGRGRIFIGHRAVLESGERGGLHSLWGVGQRGDILCQIKEHLSQISYNGQSVSVKKNVGHGRRLLQEPFYVNVSIQVQEQDLNASLASPLAFTSLQEIFPKRPPTTLNVRMQDGSFHFTSPDRHSQGSDFPITLRVEVEKGGESLLVDSVKDDSICKTFKVGPELRITQLQIDDSCMEFTGEFLVTP